MAGSIEVDRAPLLRLLMIVFVLGMTIGGGLWCVVAALFALGAVGSVGSMGSYFRIRSAFSLGAKRLAKLLECPNGDLAAEVNQFFTNTLARHESGNRPDSSTSNLSPEHPLQDVFCEASNSHESATMTKNKIEKSKLRASQDSLTEGSHSSHPQSVC